MGGCRTPGATCRERGQGVAGSPERAASTTRAKPVGSSPSPPAAPTLTGWPRSISWSEFQEITARPGGQSEDAQIASETEQPSEVSVVRDSGRLRLAGYVSTLVVRRSESWVVASAKSAALLAHEQGHFDITGLVGRDMIADLAALRAATADELRRGVNDILTRQQAFATRMTEQYDTDTNHGRDAAAQQKWERHLRGLIDGGSRMTGGPPP